MTHMTQAKLDSKDELAPLTEAQRERIWKLRTYGKGGVGGCDVLTAPGADGSVEVFCREGERYMMLDRDGRLHPGEEAS
jgi:hypothetical protein